MLDVLAYAGDALSILALSIMFSLSQALSRRDGARVSIWLLPALAVLVLFPLGWAARVWPQGPDQAVIVLALRALAGSLLAIAHLSWMRRRG